MRGQVLDRGRSDLFKEFIRAWSGEVILHPGYQVLVAVIRGKTIMSRLTCARHRRCWPFHESTCAIHPRPDRCIELACRSLQKEPSLRRAEGGGHTDQSYQALLGLLSLWMHSSSLLESQTCGSTWRGIGYMMVVVLQRRPATDCDGIGERVPTDEL